MVSCVSVLSQKWDERERVKERNRAFTSFFSFLFLLLHFLLSTIFLFTFLISEKSCVCATVENCVTVKVKDYENWYYGFIRISTLTAVSCCTIEIPLVSFVGKWHAYEGLRC